MKITRKQLRKLIKEALKIGDYEIPTPLPPGAFGSKASQRRRAFQNDPDIVGSLSDLEKADPRSASELALILGSPELPMTPPGFYEKHKKAIQMTEPVAYSAIRDYLHAIQDMFANPHDDEKMRKAGDLRQTYDEVKGNLDYETFRKYSRKAQQELMNFATKASKDAD